MKFDFATNRKVKTLDVVPENLRAFYQEGEDGFDLKTDEVTTAAVAVITGQNKALVKVRKEVEDAKGANAVDLSVLAEFGETPEKIAETVKTKIQELSNTASNSQKDVQSRISAIKKEHTEAMQKALAEKDQVLTEQQAILHNYMLDTSIMTAASAYKGLNGKLVAPFALKQMKVIDVDNSGRPKVVVVDAAGEPRYSKMAERAGELMQPDELLIEMSEQSDFKPLFPSDQAATGGGARPQRPFNSTRTNAVENMTAAEKITHGLNKKK